MVETNYTTFHAPFFRKLSDDQLRKLHAASLEILERTGVDVYEEEALALLKKAGVPIVDGNHAHIQPVGRDYFWMRHEADMVFADIQNRHVNLVVDDQPFIHPTGKNLHHAAS